jgi:hypothetical protein
VRLLVGRMRETVGNYLAGTLLVMTITRCSSPPVALCGSALAGLAGVVLAVPLAAAAQVLVQEILRERHDGWKQAHRRELAQRETGRGAAEEGLLFGGPMEDPRQTPPVKAEHADAPESHGRH